MVIRIYCPHCGNGIKVSQERLGEKIRCKHCEERFVLEEEEEASAKPVSRKKKKKEKLQESNGKKWLVLGVAGGGIGLLLLVVLVLLLRPGSDSSSPDNQSTKIKAGTLSQAVGEADKKDPGWRLKDLEAKRPVLADAENSALHVQAIGRFLRSGWEKALAAVPLDVGGKTDLTPHQQKILVFLPAQTAQQARGLADYPRGRFQVTFAGKLFMTKVEHLYDVKEIRNLLYYDVLAQSSDMAGAGKSVRALLNLGRSIGDEPATISQLVRMAAHQQAVLSIERLLKQGQPSDADLKRIQDLLEEEVKYNALLTIARAERALWHETWTRIASGQDWESLLPKALSVKKPKKSRKSKPVEFPFEKSQVEVTHTWTLNFMNAWVETAKLSLHEQRTRIKELEANVADAPFMAKATLPNISKVQDAWSRYQVSTRAAYLALGVERYRQKHQRWPESLEVVQKEKYVREIPWPPHVAKSGSKVTDPGVWSYQAPGKTETYCSIKAATGDGTSGDFEFRIYDPNSRLSR